MRSTRVSASRRVTAGSSNSRLGLARGAFTERGSRLLLWPVGGDRLDVALATSGVQVGDHFPVFSLGFADDNYLQQSLTVDAHPGRLDVTSKAKPYTISLPGLATLLLRLPRGLSHLLVMARVNRWWPNDGGGRLTSDVVEATIEYATNATLIRHETREDCNGLTVLLTLEASAGQSLYFHIGQRAEVFADSLSPDAALGAASSWWNKWFAAAPLVEGPLRQAYTQALWTLGANLLTTRLDPRWEVVVPSKSRYVGMWQWDAYFHAIALRHIDPNGARDQLRMALAHQLETGMLPDAVFDDRIVSDNSDPAVLTFKSEGGHSGAGAQAATPPTPVTKPPLTAWAVWKVHEIAPSRRFLEEVYAPIVRSHRWWFEHSTPFERGLPMYLHPYSSGADDSPLWDSGMPVASPDLIAYLIVQYDHLGRIAETIDLAVEAGAWRAEAASLTRRLVRANWDDTSGLFVAKHNRQPITTNTIFGLMPIITARLPSRIASRLVETLCDPKRFWTRHPVPTVALDDPKFSPAVLWRGPVWLFTNYLLIDGLHRSGFAEVGRRLRDASLAMVAAHPEMAEFYHPITGVPPSTAALGFSGTAALFVDLAIDASRERDGPDAHS